MVIMLRIPTLFEPYWYGDEGIYLVIGQALNRGVELYKGIHDNKPPLLYVVAALAGGSQFWFKFAAMAWNVVTVVVFAKVADGVLGEKHKGAVRVATMVVGLLTTLPLLEGNIANAELFFLLLTIGAVGVLWDKEASVTKVFWGGVLLGLGGLFKMPAIIEAAVWPVLWLGGMEKDWLKKSAVLAVGVGVPVIASVGFFASRGVLSEYLAAAAGQNVGYLSSWTPAGTGGIYTLTGRWVVATVLVVLIGLGLWKKRLGKSEALVGLWAVLALFGALLSGRPYPHYLLQTVGAVGLAAGLVGGSNKVGKVVGIGVVTMVMVTFGLFGFYRYRIWEYYVNFASWATGQRSQENYYAWFNKGVLDNYELAGIIAGGSGAEDDLFVWGDEPMIYALAKRKPVGKYVVKYHILDFGAEKKTMNALMENPPKHIVSFGQEELLPGFSDLIAWKYHLETEVGGGKLYRRSKAAWWKY
jgi:hypothetical protein